MKHINLLKGAVPALAMAAGLALSAGSATAEIKLNSWLGPNHPLNTGGYVPYIEKMEADSNGEMKFRLFLAGRKFCRMQ